MEREPYDSHPPNSSCADALHSFISGHSDSFDWSMSPGRVDGKLADRSIEVGGPQPGPELLGSPSGSVVD